VVEVINDLFHITINYNKIFKNNNYVQVEIA
jgi:hypothetical protein